jgi:putative transposase
LPFFFCNPTPNKSDGSESHPYLMKQRSPYDEIGRRRLPHDPPHFIETSNAIFFVTICCQPRGKNQLCWPEISRLIFDTARFYEDQHDWYIRLLLLMPDHLHLLASLNADSGMKKIVTSWKRYIAKHADVHWQRDFFDHRLRRDENFSQKAEYIRQNPVRAGLVSRAEDWPYLIQAR